MLSILPGHNVLNRMDKFSIEEGGIFLRVTSHDYGAFRIIMILLLLDIQDRLKRLTSRIDSIMGNNCDER
jgi:hypothetical protein